MTRRKRHKFFDESGNYYDGLLKNGKKDDHNGLWVECCGRSFRGHWKEDVRHGRGELTINFPNYYVIGGDDGVNENEPSDDIYGLWEENGGWVKKRITKLPRKRSVSSAQIYSHYIFVLGGYNGKMAIDWVDRYDLLNNTWTTMAPMRERRASLCTVKDGPYIYALGGVRRGIVTDLIERYHCDKNKWEIFGHLDYARSGFGAVLYQKKFYVFGGICQNLDSKVPMEIFDLVTGNHECCYDMQLSRHSFGHCFGYRNGNEGFFIIGGQTKKKSGNALKYLDNCFFYNMKHQKMEMLQPLPMTLIYASVRQTDSGVLLCHGFTGKSIVTKKDRLYMYQMAEDTWTWQDKLGLYCGAATTHVEKDTVLSIKGRWINNQLDGNVIITEKYGTGTQNTRGRFANGKKEGVFANLETQGKVKYKHDIPYSKEEQKIERRLLRIKVPYFLQCPISLQLMRDPVVTEAGFTYDREAIEKWFYEHSFDPLSRKAVSNRLISNRLIRNLIDDFSTKKGLEGWLVVAKE